MNFEIYLENKIRETISSWKDKDIYAISFLISCNDIKEKSFPEVSIGYNTESDCDFASSHSEERWNYAYWCQNNIEIISCRNAFEYELLLGWLRDNGITDVGEPEQFDNAYDEDGNYIGKGPSGFIELVYLLSSIACKLQKNDFVNEQFGCIPIVIHDLEYSWYSIDATKKANPNEEAKCFIEAVKNNFEV